MNRKLSVLGFTFTIVLGWLLCGCSGQPGAASESGNLPVSNLDVKKMGADSSPEAKKMPVETSYPLPANDNPPVNPYHPEPDLGYPIPSDGNPGVPPQGEAELPLSVQLALGTYKLESTEYAVTAEQAANLLLLWKVAYNLSTADDVNTEDLEAAFEQIQDAMTAEQMEAILSVEMTREDITTLAEELGVDLPSGPFPTLSAEQQATMKALGQSGMPPAGVTPGADGPDGYPGPMGTPPPGGAQNPPDGGNPMGRPGGQGGFEAIFYQAIIDLLESKIQ
jgi:hypothetical protein